ncbi:MAG TPA: M14 metallopeptidase family protein [Gemmatimonadaceae bacterium]|nr:M14 metallopeptidase family protein [Gemmatimonadaceae bacterium]
MEPRDLRRTPVAFALALAVASLAAPAVAHAQRPVIPTPQSVFGFPVGADFHLIDYDASIAYFKRLAAVSDRIKLVDVGVTANGHPWTLAIISSPENLAKLDHYRDIAQRLAHPEGLAAVDAHLLAREGRAFVDISGGLHASEVAGAQHTIQLAYDLLAHADDPEMKEILDNDVLLLWPSINPDGQNIVVHWYEENVGTPYEVAPLHELYEKYVGHDDNRDAYMLNVVESRVIARTWREWEPDIIYVHHQSSPVPTRIWLPPFAEPIAPEVPALMSREVNTIGMTIAQELESHGMPGATHMGTGFDAWYPGYIDYMPMLMNIDAFWTETALYQYATPHFYTIRDFPPEYRDLRPRSLYPSPWKGGWWRLRDAVDYMETASLAVLDYAAKYREEILYNRYVAGTKTIARYRKNPPFAYIVPRAQHDPVAAADMLKRFAFNGVRIEALSRPAAYDGVTYPAGTWVIPMDQEFAQFVKQLMEPQDYPDLREFPGGPPEQPYDAAGWTLPYQMGVRVVEAAEPLSEEFAGALAPVAGKPVDWRTAPGAPLETNAEAAGIEPLPGGLSGAGAVAALDPAQNNVFRFLNRALAAGGAVAFQPGGPGASGRYLVSGLSPDKLDALATALAVRGERVANAAGAMAVRPRIAVYKPWTASMDEGWTQWLLDQYEFKYSVLTNADIQAGDLNARFDVILIASDSPRSIMDGYAHGTVPPRYEGGLGAVGVGALDDFVIAGGTLVTLNASAQFAIDQLHLPVRNVVGDLQRKDFFASGSILRVTADPAHPVMAGMPAQADVFFDDSPVFTTLTGFAGSALATYQTAGSPLRSGYLLGEKYLQGYAAALDVQHGKGHVVLVGFRPQWRGQPVGTYRVVLNAALFGGRVSAGAKGTPGFWTAPAIAPCDSGRCTPPRARAPRGGP